MLRYSPPKRTLGPRAQANQKARRETWPAVLRRAGFRCEMCQSREQLFWCHVFGRPATGLKLGEWANTEALTAALCQSCHDALDRRRPTTVEDRERVSALILAAAMYFRSDCVDWGESPAGTEGYSPVDLVREMVRRLEANGMRP